jgi:hypothetical protein
MQLLKLMQNLVRLGEPLPWGVRDARAICFWRRASDGQSAQLTAILERGAFVDVEEVKAAAKRAAEGREAEAAAGQHLYAVGACAVAARPAAARQRRSPTSRRAPTRWRATSSRSPSATPTSRST